MTTLDRIEAAVKAGKLLASAAENLRAFLAAKLPAWAHASIEELVAKETWSELNDRFYRYLEFGTGGMRGRTIAVVPAAAETGKVSASGAPELMVWGDGTATRDLLYVADAARGVIDALERYDAADPVNLGTGREVTVRELVETVVQACDYRGRLVFDATKPQGAPRRALDATRAREAFGFQASTSLASGLRATIDWYRTTAATGKG